uniref:BTB domain-containing protein n=1 Tax=Parastrongyloides trichosuri TaxID=131310 RepID=A0A0N4ZQY8_PARTI
MIKIENTIEEQMEEIRLKEDDISEFIKLLDFIYLFHKEITKDNVKTLLRMGDIFDIAYVMEQYKTFLIVLI